MEKRNSHRWLHVSILILLPLTLSLFVYYFSFNVDHPFVSPYDYGSLDNFFPVEDGHPAGEISLLAREDDPYACSKSKPCSNGACWYVYPFLTGILYCAIVRVTDTGAAASLVSADMAQPTVEKDALRTALRQQNAASLQRRATRNVPSMYAAASTYSSLHDTEAITISLYLF